MKAPVVGVISAVILTVLAPVGFGIAQAGGTHSDAPVLSFEDQEALGQGSPSTPYTENRPVLSFGDEMQLRNPTEAGNLPDGSDAEASIVEVDGVPHYLFGGKLYGPED